MSKLPWMKLYPSDWQTDPAVGACLLEARGLWIEFVLMMHQAGRTGEVSGKVATLAKQMRAEVPAVEWAIEELRHAGVTDVTLRDGVVTLVCRRLQREYKRNSSHSLRQDRYLARRSCDARVTGERSEVRGQKSLRGSKTGGSSGPSGPEVVSSVKGLPWGSEACADWAEYRGEPPAGRIGKVGLGEARRKRSPSGIAGRPTDSGEEVHGRRRCPEDPGVH